MFTYFQFEFKNLIKINLMLVNNYSWEKYVSVNGSYWPGYIHVTAKTNKEPLPLSKCSASLWKHHLVPCCEMIKVPDRTKTIPLNITAPTVAIIGAGMAGLSAAVRLIKAGINDIIILELKPRPGGRIHSNKIGRTVVEFGPDLIEGACVANPVYNLACLENILLQNKIKKKQIYLTSKGQTFVENEGANWFLQNLLTEASGYFNRTDDNSDISLGHFLKAKVQEGTEKMHGKDRRHFEAALAGLINGLRGRIGDDLNSVSLRNYGSFIEIPGGSITIPRGSIGLINPLVKEIPDHKIIYSKNVQNIRYGLISVDSPRAVVRCCDGDEYLADYVICTVSLGVLKCSVDTLFMPPLPSDKIDAIRAIGFGLITRIFLEYEKPFWFKGERTTFYMSWAEGEKETSESWVRGITSIEEIPGRNYILRVTVAGREAVWVEQATRTMIAEEITQFLRTVTGDNSLPCPKDLSITTWCTDLGVLGARSYLGIGATVRHQCDLASPVPGKCDEGPPVLLFAGEATSPGHFGTMQGARISGIREADRIIELTLALKGPPRHSNLTQFLPLKPCPCDHPCMKEMEEPCSPPPPPPCPPSIKETDKKLSKNPCCIPFKEQYPNQ